MQLIALSAATLVATVSAGGLAINQFNFNSSCDASQPKIQVFNKCNYDVHLWSVQKGLGCPAEDGVVLKAGSGLYQENFRIDTTVGISLKISKDKDCKGAGGVNSAQVEYFQDAQKTTFFDMSYVNCEGNDCPSRKEGFTMRAGSQVGKYAYNFDNTQCPLIVCNGKESCNKVAYVDPNDPQTKSCYEGSDIVVNLCSTEGPGCDHSTPMVAIPKNLLSLMSGGGSGSNNNQQPKSSSKVEASVKPSSTPAPLPSTSAQAPKSASIKKQEAPASSAPASSPAVVTPSPVAQQPPHVKTEVVYVTAVEYTYAKRHGHGHKHFHA